MDRPHQSSPSDPHRRLRRHTYQEGPGFLFLATRGGRPPDRACARMSVACASASAACARRSPRASPRPSPSVSAGRACIAGGAATRRAASRRCASGHGDRPGSAAGLGRAGRHRGAPPDLLEQQAPRRGVHAPGHLPARPPRRRCPPRRARHGAPLGPPGARPGLRAEPARRALAHRHQGALLPAARPGRLHEGLDRRASSTTTAASSSACASCPGRRPSPSSPGCATASSCAGMPLEVMSDNGSPVRRLDARRPDALRQDARGAAHPARPDAGELALDERQDRALLGRAPVRAARPRGLPDARGRRRRPDPLRASTTTTTGSTASSAGRPRPSATTARPSPTGASSTSRRSSISRAGSPS